MEHKSTESVLQALKRRNFMIQNGNKSLPGSDLVSPTCRTMTDNCFDWPFGVGP